MKERTSERSNHMKQVHLICNAHIDPIWQWDWQEGAGAVLSTFRSAVNLAREFDYVFCHNEAAIYKYVEEYDKLKSKLNCKFEYDEILGFNKEYIIMKK